MRNCPRRSRRPPFDFDSQHAIEQRFAIKLPRNVPRTAGELLAVVWRLVRSRNAADARPAARLVFRMLQGILADVCRVPPQRIRPSTRLDVLMPKRERRAIWAALRERAHDCLPPLRVPRPVEKLGDVLLMLGLGALAVLGCLALTFRFWSAVGPHAPRFLINWFSSGHGIRVFYPLLLLIVMIALLVHGFLAVARLLNRWLQVDVLIPPDLSDVRGLTRHVQSNLPTERRAEYVRPLAWTEGLAWCALRQIIADRMGVDRRQVTRETPVAEHLGRPRLCEVCGYDTRSSGNRCPECGAPVRLTPASPALLEQLQRPPPLTPRNLLAFAVFRFRSTAVSPGSVVVAVGLLLTSLEVVPLAWIIIVVGLMMWASRLFYFPDWFGVALWRPVSCPSCGARLRLDLTRNEGIFLTCVPCGRRYQGY